MGQFGPYFCPMKKRVTDPAARGLRYGLYSGNALRAGPNGTLERAIIEKSRRASMASLCSRRRIVMRRARFNAYLAVSCGVLFTVFSLPAFAKTLCVNSAGSSGCYKKIQTAVNNASAYDVIHVAAGEYKEQVTIGKSLSLLGSGGNLTTIDATGLAHGIFVDGFDHPGLHNVTISRFTIRNATFEGILVVSASDVTIRNNNITGNDKS